MESKRKMAIVSRMLVPDIALIDPEITMTMGPELTAATGIDALKGMRIIPAALPLAVGSPRDAQARSLMSRASMEAGLAFSNAILGAVHAMAHAFGGLYDTPHGECNSILLPKVVRTNFHPRRRSTARLPMPSALPYRAMIPTGTA
jgi:alcohol dehydrogenase class IV